MHLRDNGDDRISMGDGVVTMEVFLHAFCSVPRVLTVDIIRQHHILDALGSLECTSKGIISIHETLSLFEIYRTSGPEHLVPRALDSYHTASDEVHKFPGLGNAADGKLATGRSLRVEVGHA